LGALETKEPGVILYRAKLTDILTMNLPENKIHLNKKLADLGSFPTQSTLYFTDRFEHQSTFTVMADGIHSLARKKHFPQINIRYANRVMWRGIANLAIM
jgi:2-polyprenyl-6-methoxyphenol hydroxylase-like FAD-dependent oxidoreductase